MVGFASSWLCRAWVDASKAFPWIGREDLSIFSADPLTVTYGAAGRFIRWIKCTKFTGRPRFGVPILAYEVESITFLMAERACSSRFFSKDLSGASGSTWSCFDLCSVTFSTEFKMSCGLIDGDVWWVLDFIGHKRNIFLVFGKIAQE